MTILISSDEIKKTLPDYNPNHAENYQSESTKLADKSFYEHLNHSDSVEVIIMAGGAASGKTEFLATHLEDNNTDKIILDTTLSTIIGARIKISKIIKLGKKPVLYYVVPDSLYRAYIAFLNRDRKFRDEHFFRTHSGSRKTLLWVIDNYPEISINIIESSYTKDQKLQFARIEFLNRDELGKYANRIQLSEADIIKLVTQI